MKFYILLENIKIFAYHGFFTQENDVGNFFILNIKLEVMDCSSLESDCLLDTISYADVYQIMKEEMAINAKLLEHVGWRIIKHLKNKYNNIETVELKITKQSPPIEGVIGSASILLID